jgi:hypothetical protein
MSDTLWGLVFMFAVPAAWIWLQVKTIALGRLFGGLWLVAAWLPVAVMALAILVAVLGVMAGSNLAPIYIFLAAPLCLAWVMAFHAVLWFKAG